MHAVVRAADGVLLGIVTVEPGARDGETELSYQFLPEHWGHGYAREAVAAVLDATLRARRAWSRSPRRRTTAPDGSSRPSA